jgi:carbon storage regulator
MLVLTRKPHENVIITTPDETITVRVLRIEKGTVRLGIDAPPEVIIDREEITKKKEIANQFNR